ncbi:DUF899 domain-containing protein [Catenulispora subtropica]
MSLPEITTREEWLAARKALLAKEKELRRAQDALNTERRMLPMVRIDEPYRFTGPDEQVGLADLFDGKRQLVIQHVMFDPSWEDACMGCTASIDELSTGLFRHLEARDTRYVFVARAPYEKIAAYAAKRGWDLPFYSSFGSRFNYDFGVTTDPTVMPVVWNYRNAAELEEAGEAWILEGSSEQPGMSCFLRDGDEIFHTYSTYARGTDFGGAYSILDLTALGRQEEWEEPKGRAVNVRPNMPTFD